MSCLVCAIGRGGRLGPQARARAHRRGGERSFICLRSWSPTPTVSLSVALCAAYVLAIERGRSLPTHQLTTTHTHIHTHTHTHTHARTHTHSHTCTEVISMEDQPSLSLSLSRRPITGGAAAGVLPQKPPGHTVRAAEPGGEQGGARDDQGHVEGGGGEAEAGK